MEEREIVAIDLFRKTLFTHALDMWTRCFTASGGLPNEFDLVTRKFVWSHGLIQESDDKARALARA